MGRLKRHGELGGSAGIVPVHREVFSIGHEGEVCAAQRTEGTGRRIGSGVVGVGESNLEDVVVVDAPV